MLGKASSTARAGVMLVLRMASVLALFSNPAHGQFQREDPQTPAEIVNYFVYADAMWPGEHEPVRQRLRQRARECAPIIAWHLRLPDNLDDWVMDVEPPVGQPFSRALTAMFRHRLLQELGREHADPILKRFFNGSALLLSQSSLHLAKLAAGKADDEVELVRMLRAQEYFSGLMMRAIRVVMEMRSPVLVEPVLEFYEAGVEHRYTHWADYALIHSPQHPDVIPRLRAVMEDPEIPQSVREEIGRAFERYAASLV